MNVIEDSAFTLAIRRKIIQPHFQPIFHLQSGKFRAIEARVRWSTTSRETLTAKAIVTKALELQQEIALDVLMLQQTYKAMADLTRSQTPLVQCAVNICANSVVSEIFFQMAEELLEDYPSFKWKVTLEVPISAFESYPFKARDAILKLSKLGFSISLDHVTDVNQIKDAGRNLPILSIKLAESLVAELLDDQLTKEKIKEIVESAHGNKLLVGAEGISKIEQFDFLREVKCDEGQGMLICRPTPVNGLSPLLNRGGYW